MPVSFPALSGRVKGTGELVVSVSTSPRFYFVFWASASPFLATPVSFWTTVNGAAVPTSPSAAKLPSLSLASNPGHQILIQRITAADTPSVGYFVEEPLCLSLLEPAVQSAVEVYAF